MADGTIRVSTKIDTSGAKADLDKLQKECEKTAVNIEEAGRRMDSAFGGKSSKQLATSLEKANKELDKTNEKLAEVEKQMQDKAKWWEEDYAKVANDAQAAVLDDLMAMDMAPLNNQWEKLTQKAREQEEVVLSIEEAQKEAAKAEREAAEEKEREAEAAKIAAEENRRAKEEERELAKATKDASLKAKGLSSAFAGLGGITSGMKKLVFAVLGARSAYIALRKAVSSYIEGNQQLSQTVSMTWSTLGEMMGPAIEGIINLLAKAIAYVNAFVQALTGINFIARANEKALKKQASATGAAAKAQKSLAAFDEQNKLQDNSGGGGGAGGGAGIAGSLFDGIDADLSFFDPLFEAIDRLKEDALPLLETLKELGKWVLDNILLPVADWAANSVLPEILDIIGGCLLVLNDALEYLQPIAQWFWDNILKPVAEWTGGVIVDVLSKIGDWIHEHHETLGKVAAIIGVLIGLFEVIPALIVGIFTTFGTVLAALASPITWIVAIVGGLIALFVTLYDDCEEFREGVQKAWDGIKEIFQGAIDFIKGLFTGDEDLMEEGWKKIKEGGRRLFDGLLEGLQAGWEWCKEKVKSLWEKLVKGFKDFFGIHSPSTLFKDFGKYMMDGLINGLSGALQRVKQAAQNVWTAIKNVFSSVTDWFKGVFTSAWTAVKNVFSTGGKVFDGIKEGIASTFKTIVNGLIGGINKVIAVPFNAINKLLNKIKDIQILGISPFSGFWSYNPLSVPQIPKLARGGIVNNPGRGVPAIIGEAGREAVLPLDKNTEWMDMLADRINGGSDRKAVIQVILSGKKIYEQIVDLQQKKQFATNGGF